jgi:hypothetical protein
MVAASGQPKLWELAPPEARKKVIELTRMVEREEAMGKIEDRTLRGTAKTSKPSSMLARTISCSKATPSSSAESLMTRLL